MEGVADGDLAAQLVAGLHQIGHHDGSKAAGASGLDAGQAVFQDPGVCGVDAQRRGRAQEDVRRGLRAKALVAGLYRLEIVKDARVPKDRGDRCVLGRRGDRHRDVVGGQGGQKIVQAGLLRGAGLGKELLNDGVVVVEGLRDLGRATVDFIGELQGALAGRAG